MRENVTVHELLNHAAQRHRAGDLAEAESHYRKILSRHPDHPDALHLLGLIAFQTGHLEAAAELIARAIKNNPAAADFYGNHGVVLAAQGNFDAAVAAFDRAIAMEPGHLHAVAKLGELYCLNRQWDRAIEVFSLGLAARADHAAWHHEFGRILAHLARFDEAARHCRRAIALDGNFAAAYVTLGGAMLGMGDLDAARALYQSALVLLPGDGDILNNLGNTHKDAGEIERAMEYYDQAIAAKPDRADLLSNRVYALHFHPGYDAAAIVAEHRKWNERFASRVKTRGAPHPNIREPGRRLRVGYVSSDFREHVVGWNFLPLLSEHDRSRFEVFCYSNVSAADQMTQRLRDAAEVWRDIALLDDDAAAELIRADRIDILVDLSLHMAGNRLLLFARKPAPVQVTYVAYCSTSGVAAIDYRLSDPYLDPEGVDLRCYTEQTIRLAKSYWCYRPGRIAPDVHPPPAKKIGVVTFGCLNNFAKVSAACLDLWAKVINATLASRLVLNCPRGSHREAVLGRFSAAGVAPDRIEFVGPQSWDNYMRTYHRIDIALDPFPHGGGITTCDALWMGVPVVTLSGKTAVGRGGRSILTNISLPQWIAGSPEGYIKIAGDLAADMERLEAIRLELRERMSSSPLMDAKARSRDLEAAYDQMWRRWRELEPYSALEWSDQGDSLFQLNRFEEAGAAYSRAIHLDGNNPDTWHNLGAARQRAGSLEDSVRAFRRAIELRPKYAEAHYHLGIVLDALADLSGSTSCYRQAIALRPEFADAYNNLANAILPQGKVEEAVACYGRGLRIKPDHAAMAGNRLFALQFHGGFDAQAILREHKAWNERFCEPLRRTIQPHGNDRSIGRRLRIGYLSPNFYSNCQAMFMAPLLANHDHAEVEVFCYSDVARADGVTGRLQSFSDVWRNTLGMSDEALADLVRQDGIDLLLDLTMHMAGNRALMLARKPTPLQVAWLAYPGTSGIGTTDYRLTDPYLDPPGLHDGDYTEKSVRLPDTFWCYEPRAVDEKTHEVASLPQATNGFVTFGCLNNFCKINERVIGLWSRVLREVPQSRLRLLAPDGEARRWALERFSDHGIGADRVDFVSRQLRRLSMAEFNRIDIGLDTLPYNGHTTSLDSFWMGVPVVTRVGETVVGRAGWSQLSNLGLTDLAASDDDQFVKIATSLAGDQPRLSELRNTLRERMLASPLMNGRRFARNMEAAYRAMWRTWREGQSR